MTTATYNITRGSEAYFCKTFKAFHNFHQILMAIELQLFLLVRVTVNASLVRITHTQTRTCTRVSAEEYVIKTGRSNQNRKY